MRHTPSALLAMSADSVDKLKHNLELALADLNSQSQESFAAQLHAITSNDHNETYRISCVAQNQDHLLQQVAEIDFHALETAPIWETPPKLAFLYTGQGAQYLGMGQYLYLHQPVFHDAMDQCAKLLKPHDIDLIELLYPNELDHDNDTQVEAASNAINQTGNTQPLMFALEYAITQLWQSWGITPNLVMGHSVGEYPAAVVAGMMSLKDGIALICQRAKLMQALPSGGVMAAVMASQTTLAHFDMTGVDIAGLNGPKQTVISGEEAPVLALLEQLKQQGIRHRQLQVSHAFHSSLMDPMLEDYGKAADKLTFSAPNIPLVSNVTGKALSKKVVDGKYWQQHVRKPVNFIGGMQTLAEAGTDIFIEVGPQPVLTNMGMRCLEDAKAKTWLASLNQSTDGVTQMLTCLANLWQLGFEIDWQKVSF